ncbi:hypothetical protein JXB41_08665 [Candidatus Woesearchaeota archaeon]|nr:hypothetical protein [Candidatus Woesearchaeota archaeon]
MDLSGEVTPIEVRDAIIECFYQAHKGLLEDKVGATEEDSKVYTRGAVVAIVKTQFSKIKADFNNPTKEDLIKICDELAKLACQFRSCEEIKKHYCEIMELMRRLP